MKSNISLASVAMAPSPPDMVKMADRSPRDRSKQSNILARSKESSTYRALVGAAAVEAEMSDQLTGVQGDVAHEGLHTFMVHLSF